jgi:antitoxin component of MazEF toxin-antitoxin module
MESALDSAYAEERTPTIERPFMSSLPIVPLGDSGAIVLSREVLQALGLKVGDVVEATLGEAEVVLRAAPATPRSLEDITEAVLAARKDAYERLA